MVVVVVVMSIMMVGLRGCIERRKWPRGHVIQYLVLPFPFHRLTIPLGVEEALKTMLLP